VIIGTAFASAAASKIVSPLWSELCMHKTLKYVKKLGYTEVQKYVGVQKYSTEK